MLGSWLGDGVRRPSNAMAIVQTPLLFAGDHAEALVGADGCERQHDEVAPGHVGADGAGGLGSGGQRFDGVGEAVRVRRGRRWESLVTQRCRASTNPRLAVGGVRVRVTKSERPTYSG